MSLEKLNNKIRKKQIAETALNVMASKGVRGFRLSDVAQEIGIVPSAIYRHFKNKDEVLYTVIEIIRDTLHDNIRIVCEKTNDSLRRLTLLLSQHLNMIRKNLIINAIVFYGDFYSKDPARKKEVYTMINEYIDNIASIVRQGQEAGVIRKDFDPRTIAVLYLGIFRAGVPIWQLSDGEFDLNKHVEKSWVILREAISSN